MFSSTIPDRLGRKPRVALYSHDTMGIGHMRRNILIAQTLARSADVGQCAAHCRRPRSRRFRGYRRMSIASRCPRCAKPQPAATECRNLGLPLSELIEVRSQTIAAAVRSFQPDVLIVDKEPRGAVGELQPTLNSLQARGRTRCVLGLRDVLDEPETVRRSGGLLAMKTLSATITTRSGSTATQACTTWPVNISSAQDVRNKLAYAGYLDPCQRLALPDLDSSRGMSERPWPARPYALCMVGGGQDGARLAEAFAAAQLPAGLTGVVLTGPFMPAGARRALCERRQQAPASACSISLPNRAACCARRSGWSPWGVTTRSARYSPSENLLWLYRGSLRDVSNSSALSG